MNHSDMFYPLFVSLAIGLLIGIERGWQQRESEDGSRTAGVRTYGLIGLIGGVMALLSQIYGVALLAVGFIGLALMLTIIFLARVEQRGDWGITSLMAALLSYVLAALAASGSIELAASATVVTLMLLSYKARLHGWVNRLEATELKSGIKLLLISVVVLPILPNQSWGPWEIINPYQVWWMVVIIALISFFGYFAIKLGGLHRGVLFMACFGGMASSTAVTLNLSRLARVNQANQAILASAVLFACTTMFIRMLVVITILNVTMAVQVMLPILLMTLCTLIPALLYWQQGGKVSQSANPLTNPLELKVAVSFGLILVVVMLLSAFLQGQFGDTGLITLAAISGVADVDAMVLSLLGLAETGKVTANIFVIGCIVAAGMNNLFKAGLAYGVGGAKLGNKVILPLVASLCVAIVMAFKIH